MSTRPPSHFAPTSSPADFFPCRREKLLSSACGRHGVSGHESIAKRELHGAPAAPQWHKPHGAPARHKLTTPQLAKSRPLSQPHAFHKTKYTVSIMHFDAVARKARPASAADRLGLRDAAELRPLCLASLLPPDEAARGDAGATGAEKGTSGDGCSMSSA